MKKNKLFTGILAGVCATAMLVVGTLALQGGSNTLNSFFGSNTPDPTDPPSVIIDETGYTPGVLGDKPVKVTNTGGELVYVRVRLDELLVIGAGAPTSAAAAKALPGWSTHMPNGGLYVDGAHHTDDAIHQNFALTFNNAKVVHATNFTAKTPNADTWIYEGTDGWAYWSDPLQPGASTKNLLESVARALGSTLTDNDDYYYGIDVILEWVTQEDLGLWTGASTSPAHPTAPNQTPAQLPSGSTKIKDHFGGYITNPPIVVPPVTSPYNVTVTGLKASYNIGEAVEPITVSAKLKATGATVPVTSYLVNPTTIAATTSEIVITINLGDGGTATYKQTITVTSGTQDPINPNNPLYDYQVVSSKSDYKVGDVVSTGTLTVQYKLKTGSTWTDDTSATVSDVTPTSALGLGPNNRTVYFTIGGNTYSKPLVITAAAADPVNTNPNTIITMTNGDKYQHPNDPTAHTNIYEKLDAAGMPTGEYIFYNKVGTLPSNASFANRNDRHAEILDVTYYDGSNGDIVIGGNLITTPWFQRHSNPIHCPIYLTGANYAQCFHRGTDGELGGNNEMLNVPLPDAQKVIQALINNWLP